MPKKKTRHQYTDDTHVVISRKWLITTVLGAVLVGAVGAGFSLITVANSDHFAVIALGSRTDQLEKVVVPRTEYEARYGLLQDSIKSIDKKLDTVLSLLK